MAIELFSIHPIKVPQTENKTGYEKEQGHTEIGKMDEIVRGRCYKIWITDLRRERKSMYRNDTYDSKGSKII